MRVYSVTMNSVAVSTGKSLIRISAPATMVLVVLRAQLSQSESVASNQDRIILQRCSTDGTGTANTPEKAEVGGPAATFTAVTNLTAEPTLTTSPFIDESFNWLNGWLYMPSPEERIWIPPSGRLVLRIPQTPAISLTMEAELIIGEVG